MGELTTGDITSRVSEKLKHEFVNLISDEEWETIVKVLDAIMTGYSEAEVQIYLNSEGMDMVVIRDHHLIR